VQCKARVLALMAVTGCTVGAPPGFSNGDRWVFPLVGPLENGLLVVPASVNGHGPYLFAFDPDAGVTAIDKQVVEEADLRTFSGPRAADETDTGQVRFYAEVFDLKIGNLNIDRRDVLIFPVGFYDTEGRHLNGIIGRDVLADSLVFGFDRDQGIAMLSTTKSFRAPPGAIAIRYQLVVSESQAVATHTVPGGGGRGPVVVGEAGPPRTPASSLTSNPAGGQSGSDLPEVAPVDRRIATAQIGDARLSMHLDLGAVASQLSESSWGDAKLTPADLKLRLVDEAVTVRNFTKVGIAAQVMLGPATTAHVTFAPFIEKRFGKRRVDGTLGLDFFRDYAVYANWDTKAYYLKPRAQVAATTTARLGRWGADLPACPHPGCVTAELTATGAEVTLSVVRDAQAANHALEALLGGTLANGDPAASILVELPSGTDKVTGGLSASYAGAKLAVIDVAPFTRPCVAGGGCMVALGADDSEPEAVPAPAAAAAPEGPPPPKTVLITKLHRRSGDPAIPPDDEVQKAAAGAAIAVAIVRVCLTADGKVDTAKVVKSSSVPAYDAQLLRTIQDTWTFDPAETDGKPAPVCTQVTFVPPHT